MTQHEKLLCEAIEPLISGCNHREAIEKLLRMGIISARAAEAEAIRQHIEGLIRGGQQVGLALNATAERFCSSYEKVRNIYYTRN